MPTITPSLFLNVKTLQTGDASPFFTSLTNTASPGPWARVSGPTAGALRLYLVEPSDNAIPTRVDAGTNTLHLYAKANASDADLALEIDFTKTADGDYFYYLASAADFSVSTDLWNDTGKLDLICDIIERTTGGDDVNAWRASLTLLRGVSDGGSPSPQIYVKVTAQTLTGPQKTQALTNLGGTTVGQAVFTLANPSAVRWIRLNADNTVTALSAADTATALTLGAASDVTFGTVKSAAFQAKETTGASIWTEDGSYVATWGVSNSQNIEFYGEVTGTSFNARTTAGGTLKTADGTTVATWGVTNSPNVFFDGSIEAQDGTFGTLIANTQLNTPSVFAFDSTGGVIRSANGTLVATWGVSNSTTVTFVGEVVANTLSAASGAFTVGSNGDMTATHGKFQGSAGVAGHVQLKQGTAPNGTANETTVWGISGGIGWRDGMGTSVSLALPSLSGSSLRSRKLVSSGAVLGDSTISAYGTASSVASFLLLVGDSLAGSTVNSLAVSGNTIAQQQAAWTADSNKATYDWVFVQVGLNDLDPAESAATALGRYQTLINTINSGKKSGAKVIVGTMTPCKTRLISVYGGVNGLVAYAKWQAMNTAIMGGASAITGVDGRVNAHTTALDQGDGTLALIYDQGDGIHENDAGRVIIANEWKRALIEEGFLFLTPAANTDNFFSRYLTHTILNGGRLAVGFSPGVAPSYALDVAGPEIATGAVQTRVAWQFNSGTNKYASTFVQAGSVIGGFQVYSQGYTTSGVNIQSSTIVYGDSSGGLSLGALHSSGVIRFYTGGQNLRGLIRANGTLNFPLATYADNAAALAGSLVAGDFYKTATGEVRTVV